MLCFARLMRCAIVASGTRNACAISAVVRPPTARSVSAIADGGVSAGWQHMKSSASVSSCVGTGSESASRGIEERPFLPHDECLALAPRDVAAQLIGHAPRGDVDQPRARILGNALGWPLRRRGDQRFLHRVFGRREIAEAAHDRAEHLRRELAQQVLDAGSPGRSSLLGRAARS